MAQYTSMLQSITMEQSISTPSLSLHLLPIARNSLREREFSHLILSQLRNSMSLTLHSGKRVRKESPLGIHLGVRVALDGTLSAHAWLLSTSRSGQLISTVVVSISGSLITTTRLPNLRPTTNVTSGSTTSCTQAIFTLWVRRCLSLSRTSSPSSIS